MISSRQPKEQDFGSLTLNFRRNPTADLRTPRSTFDTFCRSVLTEQTQTLWPTVHPQLRSTMQRRIQAEGDGKFFARMRQIISNPGGRLCLGDAQRLEGGKMTCPVLRNGRQVGTAGFDFHDCAWVLSSLD